MTSEDLMAPCTGCRRFGHAQEKKTVRAITTHTYLFKGAQACRQPYRTVRAEGASTAEVGAASSAHEQPVLPAEGQGGRGRAAARLSDLGA